MTTRAPMQLWTRVRTFLLQPAMLLHFISKPDDRARITSEGLPADAHFVGAYYDEARDLFRIHIASDSFEEVPLAVVPPEIAITFTAHYADPDSETGEILAGSPCYRRKEEHR